jgi:hypothetical protein
MAREAETFPPVSMGHISLGKLPLPAEPNTIGTVRSGAGPLNYVGTGSGLFLLK